ncbi:MAG: hypothetical protein ABIJ96_16905 [Elusimicrobiota bacterium]
MRHYLVDGSNAVRRGSYDPRFPEIEEQRTLEFLCRLNDLAAACGGLFRIEVFFDGPTRPLIAVDPPVHIRFPIDGYADAAILGTARSLLAQGKGAVAVTGDGQLAAQLREEGAHVIRASELEARLREDRA